jgi:FO synthase
MNESITRAAGAAFGEEMPPQELESIIRAAGRAPAQRTTLYEPAPPERTRASFGAAALQAVINTPALRYERNQPLDLLRPGLGAT